MTAELDKDERKQSANVLLDGIPEEMAKVVNPVRHASRTFSMILELSMV